MLSAWERTIHWIIWSGSATYILYRFSLESRSRLHLLDQSDFEDGWKVISRPRDSSDEEWRILKKAYLNFWPWLGGHLLLSLFCNSLLSAKKDICAVIFAGYSLFSMAYNFSLVVPVFYLSVFAICVLMCYIRCKILCYVVIFLLLYTLDSTSLFLFGDTLMPDSDDIILVELGYSWLIARVLAVSIDFINSHDKSLVQLIPSMLAYCFYLPVFYTGPVVSFNSFFSQFYVDRKPLRHMTLLKWLLCALKYVFYCYLLEFMLHFLYSTAVQFYPELAEQMDAWTLCGLGYALSVMFYLKYVIIYGIGSVFAEFDSISVPPHPKCVSRISLNSSMWKHFDRGLYLWIQRYLYVPLTGPERLLHRKLFASLCCFIFMTFWHGHQKSIFLWCFLNYLAVSVEMAITRFYATHLQSWRKKHVSENNFLRFKALLWALSFLHLCLSCMLFLSGWDVGMIFYKKILFSFPVPLLPTILIMYSQGHVALEVEMWESRKRKVT